MADLDSFDILTSIISVMDLCRVQYKVQAHTYGQAEA